MPPDSPLDVPPGTTGTTTELLILAELREINETLNFFRARFNDSRRPVQQELPTDTQAYKCPKCGGEMVKRTARSSGEEFYGCRKYPECNGTRGADGSVRGQQTTKQKPPF